MHRFVYDPTIAPYVSEYAEGHEYQVGEQKHHMILRTVPNKKYGGYAQRVTSLFLGLIIEQEPLKELDALNVEICREDEIFKCLVEIRSNLLA